MKTSALSPYNPSASTGTARAALLLAALTCSWLTDADVRHPLGDKVDMHAFASQTALYSTENNLFGDSDDDVTLDANEVGVVLSSRLTDKLSASAQVLSRNAGKSDTGDPRIDYAFLNYHIHNTVDADYSVRAGKLRLPYGLYNDTRDVASTNPSILLPQSIYIDAGRNTFFAANGVIVQGELLGDAHSLRWEAGAVQNDTNNDEISDLSGLRARKEGGGGNNLIGRIMYSGGLDKYRLGLSYREHTLLFTPSFDAYPLALPGTTITVSGTESSVKTTGWLASAQANFDRFSLSGEYGFGDISLDAIGISKHFISEAYYLQGQYFLNPSVTLLARADFFYKDRNDRDGDTFVEGLNTPITLPFLGPATTSLQRNGHSQYAEDFTLGATWSPIKNLQLRAEWHNIEGSGWLSAADNPDALDTSKHWDLLMVQAAYRF